MDRAALEHHLSSPQGRDRVPAGARAGTAGGAACGDLIRIHLAVEGERVVDAGFEADGCGTLSAAGSAVVALVRGASPIDAARVGTAQITAELGGLSPAKLHTAELAADALHRALGDAVRRDAGCVAHDRRTLVAMSGGVDSTVAALLCERAGREVVAVTLELWADRENDGERSCCSASAVRGARALAHRMGIPHFTLDLRAEFRAGVVEPFLAAHRAGETPNPCVRCNGHVRIDEMVALADRLGAHDLATGHYARVVPGPLLRAAADAAKDQSYMLAALTQETLSRLRFPLGELTKPQVRAIAAEADLPVATKRDSQDLCFLAGTTRRAFLARHGGMRERAGAVVDRRGHELARHHGAHEFTVGQRRGLGVGGAEPRYVLATDVSTNTVTVGSREDLRTTRVLVRDAVLHRPPHSVDAVKLRYRSRALPCRAHANGDLLELELLEPVDGAAPGQTACLLEGDVVLGSGVIAAA